MQCLFRLFCNEFDLEFVFVYSKHLRPMERSLLGKTSDCEEMHADVSIYNCCFHFVS